jgi:hypothetical protein
VLAAAAALAAAAVPPGATVALGAPAGPGVPVPGSTGDGDFRLKDPRITESSGLATSRAHRHTVWTVNDSGDSARVFAVDTRSGDTVGVHSFGADVWDVEALAIGPDGRMLVGDIGDNTESRSFVRVFWFDEPALGETQGSWASWELAYPDGPHDAEALLVDPRSGRLSIVTKGEPGAVYTAPVRPSRSGVNRLTRVATAPPVVTDGVVLPDGRVALRGYLRLSLYAADTWRLLAEQTLPLQPQGETIATAPDGGNSVLVGSEGVGSLIRRVELGAAGPGPSTGPTTPPPTAGATTGTYAPAVTPTVSPAPSSRADTTPPSARAGAAQGGREGRGEELPAWVWALGTAVVAAALAVTLVVNRWRRRSRPPSGPDAPSPRM